MALKYFVTGLFFLLNYLSYRQSIKETNYWIDKNGKSIPQGLFLKQWRAQDAELARWDM